MTASEWGFWVALAALVAGTGKFVDDYHIKVESKSKARALLTRWFTWLEAASVPDTAGALLAPIASLLKRRFWLTLAFLLTGYWAVTTVFYFWRRVNGPEPEPYLIYVWRWLAGTNFGWIIFMGVILVAALAGSWVMGTLLRRASRANSSWYRALLLVSGGLAGPVLSATIAVGLIVLLGLFGPYGIGLLAAAALAPVLPLLAVLVMLLLITIQMLLRVIRWILMHVFDSARSPTISPFAYASSLLGLVILGGKVAQAAVS